MTFAARATLAVAIACHPNWHRASRDLRHEYAFLSGSGASPD